MKKVLLFTLLAALTIPVQSQGRKYNKAMLASIEKMTEASDLDAGLEVAATFEEIAENYPDQWLPSYHASYLVINSSFAAADGAKSDALLDRAGKSLDRVMDLAPEESEAHALKALYLTGIISADPAGRGQYYYQDVLDAINTAKSLNPDNPRAILLNGIMTLNLPEFLGGGPEAASPIFLEAEKKFKDVQNEDPLWPTWGAELAAEELEKLEDIQEE